MRTTIAAASLLFACLAHAQEYKTEFTHVNQARLAGWDVGRGKLSKAQAPTLSVSDDAAVGKTALRVTVAHAGLWQGLRLTDSVDLGDYGGIAFHVKQNVHTSGSEWVCAVQIFFEGEGYALADAKMGLGQWTEVVLPFGSPVWKLVNRPEDWGRAKSIRFYPYRHLNTPGQYLAIDGLRLLPKAKQRSTSPRYTCKPQPTQGTDPQRTWLLDRDTDKAAVLPAYTGAVDLVFDLGRELTLTHVKLLAPPSPDWNVASAMVEISADAKQWAPAGSMTAGAKPSMSTHCLAVGRYVRVTVKRKRPDVPVRLAEVVLGRRATTHADRQGKRQAYFEGPDLPPLPADRATNRDYAFLRGKHMVAAIHRETGVVAGLWTANGTRVVLRGWDRYVFENRDGITEATEYADSCKVTESTRETLALSASADDLRIRKRYRLRGNGREEWIEKTTAFEYTGKRPDLFVTLLSNVAVDRAFRTGAYYEGAQVRCDRILADRVHFKRVMPSNKCVMLVRPGSLATVTQYRHKVNGRYCAPYYGQIPCEPYNATSTTRNGWEIGHATLKLSGKGKASVQVHTGVVPGGRFGWERHYVSLPAYREYTADLDRPTWLRDVKTIIMDSYKCGLWGRTERSASRLMTVFEDGHVVAPALTHVDGVWGELPVSGNAIGLFGALTPTDELARMFETLRRLPRFKAGLYMWLTSVNKAARDFTRHPDWFTTTNKLGEPRVIFPQLKTNFGRIMSIPAQRRELVGQVSALHRRYLQDIWYLDGGNTTVHLIDWPGLRISQDYDGQDFVRATRRVVKQLNPECAVFFNGADERMADIGYAEIGRHFGKEWRRAAARMYSYKVRQYFDPDRHMSPLYWVGDGNRYLRICTGLGFPPSGPPGLYTKNLLRYAPYCAAAFETRGFAFSPTRVSPDWREDEDTLVEAHALRAGRALVLSVVSHAKQARTEMLRAEIPFDVAAPGETVYVAQHVLKDIGTYAVPNTDASNKVAYRTTGWATGAVTELRAIKPLTVDAKGWVSLRAELPAQQLSLFSFVKTPVYFWSRNGMRANFLLPAVREHVTEARVNNGELTVTVTPDDVPRELLVLMPVSTKRGRAVSLHGLTGRIMPVPPSRSSSQFTCTLTRTAPKAGPAELSVPKTVKAGSTLDVTASAGPVRCSIWRAGTLVSLGVSDGRRVSVPVPTQAHNGKYLFRVDGTALERPFKVTGHQAGEPIAPEAPRLERKIQVTPTELAWDRATVLAGATLEYGRCLPSVDVQRHVLNAEVPKECVTYYAQSMAGIELAGVRRLALRLDHNMFPVRGLYPERHVLYERHANAFIGLMVDYGTAKGYAKRVALSVGKMNQKRASTQPAWGAARAPDHYLRLPSTIYTGEDVDGVLDLRRWAPKDWDGRVWVSVVMDLVLPSRWLNVTLQAVDPPEGRFADLKIEDVSGTLARTADRRLRAPRFKAAPKLDGSLDDPAWKKAPAEQGLFVIAGQGRAAAQKTEIRVGYDKAYLYVGMTAWETEKKGFDTTSGAAGRPWWDDGVEFALAPPAWQGRFLHQIVSADAVTFQEIATHMQGTKRKTALPVLCKARQYKDRFTVEAAIPLGTDGVPAPAPGQVWRAQFMRTRAQRDGRREHATWTPTDALHDYSRFGTVLFQ